MQSSEEYAVNWNKLDQHLQSALAGVFSSPRLQAVHQRGVVQGRARVFLPAIVAFQRSDGSQRDVAITSVLHAAGAVARITHLAPHAPVFAAPQRPPRRPLLSVSPESTHQPGQRRHTRVDNVFGASQCQQRTSDPVWIRSICVSISCATGQIVNTF